MLMVSGDRALAEGKRGAFYNTLEEFHKYWDRVDIICPRVKSEKLRVKNLFGNVFIHPAPWPLLLQPFWILREGLRILKTGNCKPETVNYHMTVHEYPPFYNGIGARLLWWKSCVPYVLEFHHISGYPKAANLKEKIYANSILWKLYWKIFGSRASAVRVVNQKQTPEFLKKAGIPEERMVYIPSMYIDLDVFKPMNFPKEYDLIFVGRLETNKGINLLFEAVSKLKVKSEKLKVLIVGAGHLSASLKSKVKSLKLENNVIFHGFAKDFPEIAELMNKSKILIMPSYNEGGPRVVLEAMACGTPVLATNVGLMPDFADKNAIKIIDWNAEDIASKAEELLENEDERNRLIQAGIEIARQFEKKEMIKNYADKLKEFVKIRT